MSTDLRSAIANWCPPWLQPIPGRDEGFRILYAIALLLDGTIEAMVEGVQARFPGYGTPTALPRLARDRQLLRGYNEPEDAFSQRLIRWREDHKRRGNPYTLLEQIRGYIYPRTARLRLVNNQGTWYTLNADGTRERVKTLPAKNWDWDGDTSLISRCWVIIYPPNALAVRDGVWGDGETWGTKADSTWGSTFTREQVDSIRSIIEEWRSSVGLYVNVIISFDDAAFDPTDTAPPLPDGTWELPGKNGAGVEIAARDAAGIYWDGRNP